MPLSTVATVNIYRRHGFKDSTVATFHRRCARQRHQARSAAGASNSPRVRAGRVGAASETAPQMIPVWHPAGSTGTGVVQLGGVPLIWKADEHE